MKLIQVFIITLVAFEHIYFMILEMFYWDKPKGMKVFGIKPDFAKATKVLAQNQGLYNGFLAAGLIWSILSLNNFESIAIFFLSCVLIAGIFGAYTTKKPKLFYIQGLPALIGLLLVIFSYIYKN